MNAAHFFEMARSAQGAQSFGVVAVLVLLAATVYAFWGRHQQKRHEAAELTLQDMAALGEVVPETIHPVVDLDRCIGCGF